MDLTVDGFLGCLLYNFVNAGVNIPKQSLGAQVQEFPQGVQVGMGLLGVNYVLFKMTEMVPNCSPKWSQQPAPSRSRLCFIL